MNENGKETKDRKVKQKEKKKERKTARVHITKAICASANLTELIEYQKTWAFAYKGRKTSFLSS